MLTNRGLPPLDHYVIRLDTGEYLADVRLKRSHLHYTLTADRSAATGLFEDGSQLVLKTLESKGVKAEREFVSK